MAMNEVLFNELPDLRRQFADKKIVYASGVYDLTHAGHVLFLEEAKKLGEILVVSVASDGLARSYKGGERPILNEQVRLKMVSSLKPVDYCFLESLDPAGITEATAKGIRQLEPDIFVVNGDAPDIPQMQEIMQNMPKTTMIILKRFSPPEFDNISTTQIIKKIRALGDE